MMNIEIHTLYINDFGHSEGGTNNKEKLQRIEPIESDYNKTIFAVKEMAQEK